MKTFFSLLAAVSVLSIAMPANAGPPPFINQRRIVSYLTTGVPVYAVYQIVGYDGMGYPIYRWVTQPATPVYVRPHYGHSYGYRGYNYRPSYGHPHHNGHVGHGWGHGHHGGHHHH